MLTWIRERFGPVVVGGIIGLIVFVFVASDAMAPRSTRGIHEGAVAGEVNGEPITLNEFSRAYNQRVDQFKQMMGGKMELTEEQIRMFRIKEGVFNDLARSRVLLQEAARMGIVASDEEVRDRVRLFPAFQKDGVFNPLQYRQVLEANRYTPGSFEKLIRDEIASGRLEQYFSERGKVVDEEIRTEWLATRDRRDVRYVLLTTSAGRKLVASGLKDSDVAEFLKAAGKEALVSQRFEAGKDKEFKGKKLEEVKQDIARALLASEKSSEALKANEGLAEKVAGKLTADSKSDTAVNELLKSAGVQVRSTGMFAKGIPYIPGIGEAKELLADAFAEKSPLDPKAGGKPKIYRSAQWILVAVVAGSEKPDPAKFDSEKLQLAQQLRLRKARALQEGWMSSLMKRAKIVGNPDVVGEGKVGETGT
jgi:hypothetical protein